MICHAVSVTAVTVVREVDGERSKEAPLDAGAAAHTTPARAAARTVARAAGNVLLGMSLGLLAYYALTDVVGRTQQGVMRERLSTLGPVGSPAPEKAVTRTGPAIDLSGWEAQDAAYWTDLAEGGVFGRIVAPKMGLDAVVLKGVRTSDLRRGPGWIPTTDMPGAAGNVALSGHRTTYLHPFRRMDSLRSGDVVDVYSPYRRYRYRVERVFSVTPDKVEVIAHTPEPVLTLTACDPPYSARRRLIARARLVEVKRIEGAPAGR